MVLLAAGRVVAQDAPDRLRAGLGEEMAEIEGSGAERLTRALRGLGAARTILRTGRGYRVGLAGPREPVIELAGGAPEVTRFALRPVSLEDVYFASTRSADEAAEAVPA